MQQEASPDGQKVVVREVENHNNSWNGSIVRINGKVDVTTQTVKVFIELRGENLKEGMFLEALMNGNAIEKSVEIPRSLLVDESKVYIVQDSALQLVQINPVFFNQKTVVVQGLEDGQIIISKSVPGSYAGMEVKIYEKGI